MKGEWCFYSRKFSDEACEEIIGLALQQDEGVGTVGGAAGEGGVSKVDGAIRKSNVIWLRRLDPLCSGLFSVIDQCVWEANNTWFGVDYQYCGADSFQFTVYREGAETGEDGDYYHTHADAAWVNEQPSQRKLSVMLQLTDPADYEGGEFRMEHISQPLPQDEIKTRGMLLVFPSLIRHGVTAVTSGVRYSLVGWYMGPPWR